MTTSPAQQAPSLVALLEEAVSLTSTRAGLVDRTISWRQWDPRLKGPDRRDRAAEQAAAAAFAAWERLEAAEEAARSPA